MVRSFFKADVVYEIHSDDTVYVHPEATDAYRQ